MIDNDDPYGFGDCTSFRNLMDNSGGEYANFIVRPTVNLEGLSVLLNSGDGELVHVKMLPDDAEMFGLRIVAAARKVREQQEGGKDE